MTSVAQVSDVIHWPIVSVVESPLFHHKIQNKKHVIQIFIFNFSVIPFVKVFLEAMIGLA